MTKKKGVRTRAEAKKLMWEYYRDNKASLPKWIREYREEIISDLASGVSARGVFGVIIDGSISDGDSAPRCAT